MTITFVNEHVMDFNFVLQEWPEAIYPPYANGPGYVISSDIAKYIVAQQLKHNLRVSNTPSYFLLLLFWISQIFNLVEKLTNF